MAGTAGVQQPVITIIGAGVIGLSTAHVLQTRHPRARITLVAAEFPSLPSTWQRSGTPSTHGRRERPSADYASMWAGAHFRPVPSLASQTSYAQLSDEKQMAFTTHRVMKQIAAQFPEAGVQAMPGAEVYEVPPDEYAALQTGDVYAGPSDKFRIMTEDRAERNGASWGCEYTTYCLNVHVYTRWLLERFLQNGGNIVEKELRGIDDAVNTSGERTSIVVNCSGRNFDNDCKTKIIRGQTVLVRNKYHRTITRVNRDGTWAFLIPRPRDGGTIVGGTKEPDDLEESPRNTTRKKLLENAVRYFPDFVGRMKDFDVVMDNVGRRPWREGGMRMEVERSHHPWKTVHGYGAGGRGYELSWGAAQRIADLVDKEIGVVVVPRL